MSDDHLRAVERRWRASGTVEDETAWLHELLRAGRLPRERLAIAAWCGHHAAFAALDAGARFAPPAREDIRRWLYQVPHGAHVVGWRAVLAALDLAGPDAALRSLDLGEHAPTCEELVVAVERWLLDPGTTLESLILARGWGLPWSQYSGPPPFEETYGLLGEAADLSGADVVLRRVRTELITWVLDRGDPVRERHDARLAKARARLE